MKKEVFKLIVQYVTIICGLLVIRIIFNFETMITAAVGLVILGIMRIEDLLSQWWEEDDDEPEEQDVPEQERSPLKKAS
jgi:hypothetical protein